jgi:hypothetical protein
MGWATFWAIFLQTHLVTLCLNFRNHWQASFRDRLVSETRDMSRMFLFFIANVKNQAVDKISTEKKQSGPGVNAVITICGAVDQFS